MLKFEPEVNLVISILDESIINLSFTHIPDADIAADVNAIANNTGIEIAEEMADLIKPEWEGRAFPFYVWKCHNIKRIAREIAIYLYEQHGLKVKTIDERFDPEGQYERTSIYR